MAEIIRSGAATFLKTEYKTISIVVVCWLRWFSSLFVERTSGITFMMGACMSSIVCILGMRSATYANVRTANRARETLLDRRDGKGCAVRRQHFGPERSGVRYAGSGAGADSCGRAWILATMGTGLIANLKCNPSIMRISTYSLGCSLVAMFNRVAGGNYTKAADISADILAKLRHDMPEDDSRVPNVVADFIGDNVNDIAGNCSDLLESFVATMSASIAIAVTLFNVRAGRERNGCDVQLYGGIYPDPSGGRRSDRLPAGPWAMRRFERWATIPLKRAESGDVDLRRALPLWWAFSAALLVFGKVALYADFTAGLGCARGFRACWAF